MLKSKRCGKENVLIRSLRGPVRFFALPAEDDDVKIFSGSAAAQPVEDDGAAEFVRERENGNLDEAKRLGKMLARKMRRLRRFGDNSRVLQQKKVLFSYVAARVIGQRCPNSVLSQAALSEFHNIVQGRSAEDYDWIQDSAAFTKYLLTENSSDKKAVGAVFAQLCKDPALQAKGMVLYYRYNSDCLAVYSKIHFS